MAFSINNLNNENRKVIGRLNDFNIIEYQKDESVSPFNAEMEYFMTEMGVKRRQLVVTMSGEKTLVTQAGAMQWTAGNLTCITGVKGVGDFLGKMVKGAVTKESAVKPEYNGKGVVVLEPTYKYILLQNVEDWVGGMSIEDGMFLACEGTVNQKVVSRSSISSALAGGEGLFNLNLQGSGVVALESNVPMNELVEVKLNNDVLKIDGNLAVCWTSSLEFTVERSSKSLLGSAVSGEGLVNVYRGTGKVLLCPVAPTRSLYTAASTIQGKAAATGSNTFGL